MRVWLDSVCDLLLALRYAPRANFTFQVNDAFMSMGAFGTFDPDTDPPPA